MADARRSTQTESSAASDSARCDSLTQQLDASEQRFQLLSEANALLLSTGEPEAIIQTIADKVMHLLGADVFFNYVLSDDAERLRLNAWGGVDERVAKMIERLELGQAICGCVARDGTRIISEDVQHNEDPRAELVRRMGIRCYVCHPLQSGGATVGTLSFGTKRTTAFSDKDIEFMRTIADAVSLAIERAEAGRALRRSEERWSLALEHFTEGAIIATEDEQLIYWNPAAQRMHGFTRSDEGIGPLDDARSTFELLTADNPRLLTLDEWPMKRIKRGEQVRDLELRLRRPDQSWEKIVSYSGTMIETTDGERLIFLSVHDLTEQRQAQEAREEELWRTSLLLEAASEFSNARDVDRILETLARLALSATAIERAYANLIDMHEQTLELKIATGGIVPPARGTVIPISTLSHVSQEAIRIGKATLLDFEAPEVNAADREIAASNDVRLALFVPLIHNGEVIGHITVDERGARHDFTPAEIALVQALASQAATALANAWLLRAEQEAAARNRMLADVSELLASTMEIDEALPQVLAMAGETMGAIGAALLVRDRDDWVVTHGWAVHETLMGNHYAAKRLTAHERARATLKPVYVEEAGGNDWEQRSARKLGFESFSIHPMIVRGQFMGTLDFSFPEPRHFDDSLRHALTRVAYVVTAAIDTARLFEAEHNIAETLQETLVVMPKRLPSISFSRAYESATSEVGRVGGDFVDLFQVAPATTGLVVGDVSGKGIDAAVITSLVRNTIRAYSVDGLSPSGVCGKTNTVMRRFTDVDAYVTLFFGLLNTQTGLLRYVSAGHPPALVLSGGSVSEELLGKNPFLGAFDDVRFFESQAVLHPGERLVLYTDGVTEARSPDGTRFLDLEGLSAVLAKHASKPTTRLASAVMKDIMKYSKGVLRDDAAILIVEPRRSRSAPRHPAAVAAKSP